MDNTIELLEQKLAVKERLVKELLARIEEKDKINQDDIGNLDECSRWIKRSTSTIYKMTSQKKIPHYKNGKHLLFNTGDILAWLEKDRQLTIDEYKSSVDQELQRHPISPWKG